MGKSLGNAIYLVDDEETISKKVMSAVTDPDKIKKDDPANPDVCMVYYYHKLVNKDEEAVNKVCSECKKGARGCVQCKKELINAMNEFLKPIHDRRKYYEDNPEEVKRILEEGTNAARERAKITMQNVRKAMRIDY